MPRPKKEYRCEGPRFTSGKGWVGRVWPSGAPKWSKWLPLGTTDREHAKKLLAAWGRTGVQPVTKRGERSFAEEAERILDEKAAKAQSPSEKKAVQYRRDRLRKYALPVIGPVPVGLLEPSHIAGVLDSMAEQGLSLRTTHNLRSDISVILRKLVRSAELKMNPAQDLELPEEATVDTRDRMHLSDEQMIAFQTRRGFGTTLDMNIMLCRCVGGHRTSDGHAGDWSHVDLIGFATMKVRRPKTDGQVGQRVGQRKSKTKNYEHAVHTVPEQYRPALRAYWESQGCPTSGPLFPLLRDAVTTPMKLKGGQVIERNGGKVGGRKGGGTSYAKAFRRAVWEEQIYSPMPVGTLIGGVPTTHAFDPENPDRGLCFFQTDTDTTRRLTFHGLRADLNAALVEAGVTDDQRIAILGHTQAATGNKHYMKQILVGVPAAALPGRLPPSGGFIPATRSKPTPRRVVGLANSTKLLARPGRFERPTFGSVDEGSALEPAQTQVDSTPEGALESPGEGVLSQTLGQNSSHRETLLAAAAQAVLEGDWERADQIRVIINAPPHLAPVHKLSDARRRQR